MDLIDAVVLGAVQGLTEFLPVSSSGHLVLAQELLGVQETGATLEVAVHLATLLSVVLYFWRDIWRVTAEFFGGGPGRKTALLVAVATLPAGLVGVLLKDQIEAFLDSPLLAAAMLIVTGVVLLLTRFAVRREDREPGVVYALLVGCAQAVAILPGISRSGSTICTALFLGDDPDHAARFSFLMALPVILGAGLLKLDDLSGSADAASGVPLLVASIVAFATGLAAIHALMTALRKGKLAVFGPYCLLLGAGALVWLLAR